MADAANEGLAMRDAYAMSRAAGKPKPQKVDLPEEMEEVVVGREESGPEVIIKRAQEKAPKANPEA